MAENPIAPGKEWTEAWLDEDAFRRQFKGTPDALRAALLQAWTTGRRPPTDTERLGLAMFLLANPDYLLPLRLLAPGVYSILEKFVAQNPAPKLRNQDISVLVDVYLAAGFELGPARAEVAKSLKKTKEAIERADQRVRNQPRQK
jgi:hypothetical protein